jgi:uncharacterized protein YbaR (Trm112 family)
MREWLLPLLICPDTGEPLSIRSVNERRDDDILSGVLSTPSWRTYPIRNGVPRFVETHYATAFGLQWNRHARTQIDRGQTQASKDRFWGETGLTPDGIRGETSSTHPLPPWILPPTVPRVEAC